MLEKTVWHQKGRIILQVCSGDINLAEMEEAWYKISELIKADNSTLPVHLIMDFSQRKSYSPELLKLPTMRNLFQLSDANFRLGWFMVIQASPNPVMLFTSTMAARFSSRKFRVVASLEEALRYLRYTDSSLNNNS